LEQVSEQVALALESARLFEQTQAALYAVQESETQLSEAMRIANMANWVFDLTAMAFTFNDRVFELLGTSSEEMGGYQVSAEKYIQEFVHPEDAGIIPQAVQEALASDDPVNFRGHVEYRLKRGDGAERYISSDYRLEVNDQGQPTHGLGSLTDITERREAEEAVRQAQERFELSVSGSNDGIWDWNILTNEVYYSTRLKEMIGYSDEDFTNDFAEFEEKLHPDDHDRVMATVGEYLEGKIETYEPEFRFRHKDGSYRWILARGIVIRDESGLPVRMAGSHTDVTERHLQEQATARRAAELATVANIGTTISTILEENQLLETVVQLTRERFDLYHCHIFLADEKNQTLQVKACGWDDDSPHDGTTEDVLIHTDQEQSLVAQAAREQQAVIVNNVRQDPNWLPNEQLPDTRSEMAIPLVAGNQVLGVLDVQDIETERFTDEDISIMTTLASQVAVALQNARTYALTQQQADQEAMINLISQRIQSTTSVESALQVAIRELGRALGAKRTNVQLGLPTQKKDQ
jgi:PAS domain S-box-containing protein